jgi:hypothetical protein
VGTGCPDCGGERETLGTIEEDRRSDVGDGNDEYSECPNCANTEAGADILQCEVCGLKHCDACSESTMFGVGAKCPTPDCAGTRKTIGRIASPSADED